MRYGSARPVWGLAFGLEQAGSRCGTTDADAPFKAWTHSAARGQLELMPSPRGRTRAKRPARPIRST